MIRSELAGLDWRYHASAVRHRCEVVDVSQFRLTVALVIVTVVVVVTVVLTVVRVDVIVLVNAVRIAVKASPVVAKQ